MAVGSPRNHKRLNLASKIQAIIDARLTDEDRLKLTALQILPRPISRKKLEIKDPAKRVFRLII